MSECTFCKKEKKYDPSCCKESLDRAIEIYHKATFAIAYKIINGRDFKEKWEMNNE